VIFVVGLEIQAWVFSWGLEYSLNEQIGFYTDLGSGISLVQIGVVYKMNN
jgi:hypothetical protein